MKIYGHDYNLPRSSKRFRNFLRKKNIKTARAAKNKER